MYPVIEPHESGMLAVGDGHLVHWEVCGNPAGKPALVLHGGPGAGCTPGMRRYFDPQAYRIVLFDQRMCGRSTPHAAEPGADLSANTTEHLIVDVERLREHLGVDRWLVQGGSWGCVLALAYAQRYPERVSEMVLCGLATGRRAETDLLTRGLGALFPEPWARFRAGVPERDRDGDLADAYHRLLMHPAPAVHSKAARDWCAWEDALVPDSPPNPAFADPRFALGFARIVTHFWRHGSWLADDEIIGSAGALAGIPATLCQGALDLGNLLGTPWQLAAAWPGNELRLVDAGHRAAGGLAEAVVDATDAFRDRLQPRRPSGAAG
ncbi:prolyl aminopeptidase [Saccharopolyspora mangrovi]|uniref:Proline iminopeptidase n=1 Tax=Saccharopolyspora mangrovi TaxID=3082379 RepID=A0ABU6ACP0_9PSEU|nr:prolyl aminopeptidase [Saccharopolyspora sp. S2-29]MEB3369228.1 prolyl aminopeptidase [Saccharopolyspora sp. S2-29]